MVFHPSVFPFLAKPECRLSDREAKMQCCLATARDFPRQPLLILPLETSTSQANHGMQQLINSYLQIQGRTEITFIWLHDLQLPKARETAYKKDDIFSLVTLGSFLTTTPMGKCSFISSSYFLGVMTMSRAEICQRSWRILAAEQRIKP